SAQTSAFALKGRGPFAVNCTRKESAECRKLATVFWAVLEEDQMSKPVCALIGVGPGNGTAIARKFSSEGYKIALLSRNEDYLNALAHALGETRAYAYDALDTTAPEKVFGKIKRELGPVDVLVYNAGSGMFGNVDEVKVSDGAKASSANVSTIAVA